jgi:hypothetical protein
MRGVRVTFFLITIAMGLLLSACSGVRPLQKGETLRCPSCGAVFTVEQGMAAEKPGK